jgi:hypothetical protein
MPSPRYFAIVPPRPLISIAQQVWKLVTTSRCSSWSSHAESALEPTMSQNITVSWRRSADAAEERAAGLEFSTSIAVRLAPQLAQNLAPAELVCPQRGHDLGRKRTNRPRRF